MPPPAVLDPTTGPLAFFGAELRKFRMKAHLSQEHLAARIKFSTSLVGFIERAQRVPSRAFVESCDAALELDGELLRLWPLLSRESSPRWFHQWLDVEQEAHTLHTWQPLVVPGLLQTEDYARAVIRGEPGITEEHAEKLVEARMERQAIFARSIPPRLWAVLDEGVLQRPIGGKAVIRRQLERLLEVAESPRIGIQILPLILGASTGTSGGFVIAQLPGSMDTVYIESATNGHVTARPQEVEAVHARYDTIRAEAHPRHVSIELIREAEKAWT